MPRNKELNRLIKDARREKIMLGSLRLFASKGLAATKISDIASETGMSQGLVYHYFKSKADIFTELVRNAFERMNTAAIALERMDLPPLEKIRLAIEHLLQGLDQNEQAGLYHLFIAQATASEAIPEEAKEIIKDQNRIPYEVMARIIKEGQKEGSIKNFDAEQMALVFWTSIKGLSIHKATHGINFKLPDSEILLGMFV